MNTPSNGFYWNCPACHQTGSFPSYSKELPLFGRCTRCGADVQVNESAVVKWLKPGDRYYHDPSKDSVFK